MEMNVTLGLISGLLSGSLGTLIVKHFLELRKEKTQHERELFKITYQRKLELAEAATGFYYTYLYKVQAINVSFKLMSQYINNFQNTDLSLDHLQKIIDDNSVQISSLVDSQYVNVNKVHLYFELGEYDSWSQEKATFFLDLLTKLRTENETMMWYLELINEAEKNKNDEVVEYYWRELGNILPSYSKNLSSLVDSLEGDSEAVKLMVRKIKDQLKMY